MTEKSKQTVVSQVDV